MNLREYRLGLDAIVNSATTAFRAVLRATYKPTADTSRADTLREITEALLPVVLEHRLRAYELAGRYLRDEARRQTPAVLEDDDIYVPDESYYSETSLRTVLRETLRGKLNEVVQNTTARLSQHVESAARQTVTRAVEDGWEPEDEDDQAHAELTRKTEQPAGVQKPGGIGTGKRRPKAWARVLTGAENCGFCVMLASRGPVYKTAKRAGALTTAPNMDGGITPNLNRYHPKCDCAVVPVYDFRKWPGQEQRRAAEAFYEKHVLNATWKDKYGEVHHGITYRNGPSDGSGNQVINALDRALRADKLDVPKLRG